MCGFYCTSTKNIKLGFVPTKKTCNLFRPLYNLNQPAHIAAVFLGVKLNKPTPSPWIHKSFANCDAVVANGVIIATVGLTADDELSDDFDITKQQANAKLIAAAPDLLAALEAMTYYFAEYEKDDSAKYGFKAARAAIAKATA
jgi:hypothetical protein